MVWREEFKLDIGKKVGLDIVDDKIVIDNKVARRFKQVIGLRGRITIPLEVREKLLNNTYKLLVKQESEQLILIPA